MGTARSTDPRNVFQGRRTAPFRFYVLAVMLAGAAALTAQLVELPWGALGHPAPALALVLLLVLVGELRPVFTGGSSDANGLLVTNAFLFAVLLRYGVGPACLFQAVVTTIVDVGRRKAPWRVAFNVSQYTLAWSAAGLVIGLLGHRGGLTTPVHLQAGDLLAALAGGVAYFVVNQLAVTRAVSLKIGESWRELLRRDLAYESLTNGALLALSPLIAMAMERGVAFVPLLLPPLFAVYQVAAVALEREREAHSDPLTGLPNRKLLIERTQEAFRQAPDGVIALALLDLDRFKEINDTLGHHAGDQLLKVVSERLAAIVREGDVVARLGGDEFAMLLPGVPDVAAAQESARRMAAAIAAPIPLEGIMVEVGASVGVAVSPEHGADLDALLQRADVAMYVAKSSGGGVAVYDPARDRNSTGRLTLLGELRQAVARDELVLHFQPKVDVDDGHVFGVEALVRWDHPTRGLLAPDEFVPAAEASDAIGPLTGWVLDHALRQLAVWRTHGLPLSIAVNVSARDLCGGELADRVEASLQAHGIAADLLHLEVTESALLAEPERAERTLQRLAAQGVWLSLDDFGTGFSSLRHLRDLPVNEIKLDRSFVQRIDDNPRDRAIVRGMIELAGGLGLQVVAEGVETEAVLDRLRQLGCHSAQGWLLHRAVPADELTPWLLERARRCVRVPSQR